MMFKYFLPTRVFFGNNCIKENASVFSSLGQKALLVTGRKSAKINGSQKDIEDVLTAVAPALFAPAAIPHDDPPGSIISRN
jgi:alcohol dehydrogenase YqhD (iron-dependent ADH family)